MSLAPMPPTQRAGIYGREPNLNKKKILVVDDDAVILRTLSIKIRENGFEVFTAKDGATAITAVRTHRPDIILLDLNFPPNVDTVSWDGFLIMEWLKRLVEADKVPIIVISAGNSEKYKSRARAAGAAAFFHKPIRHDVLFAYIRRKLHLRSATPFRLYPARS
jgi:DNA-binding response OmpR family regulator